MPINEIDNRIRLEPTEIDFDDVVGITGLAHDEFPKAGQQPRYDWMRSYLIGLLALQSSTEPPFEYRTGTLWFNRSANSVMIYNGTNWVDLAEHIALTDDLTLAQWFSIVQPKINSIQPRLTFSGVALSDGITSIPVPQSIQDQLVLLDGMHPFVYINGELVDPRNSNFVSELNSEVVLSGGVDLDTDDKFTVVIERYEVFVLESVVINQ
jgi:hypothetical protein